MLRGARGHCGTDCAGYLHTPRTAGDARDGAGHTADNPVEREGLKPGASVLVGGARQRRGAP